MFMKNVLYKTSILSTLGLFVYALFFAQHAYAITPSQINDRITVNTGNTELALNVRTTANGTITGQQLTGAVGTVIGGPQSVGVHTWWQVNFDSGVDGWVASGFTELISPPTVDIQVNNNNGPVNIEHNSPATISWSSQNATSCTASGAWTGPKSVSGSEVIENLTTSGTFTLTCTGAGGSAADSVTVNATAPPPSTTFSANDRVEVTSGPLNIRSCPGTSCSTLGTQTTGALGTVTGGATYASGYYWWQINFDSGADGWAVENYLAKYTAPPPTSNLPDVIVTALSYSNGSFTATVKNQGSVAVSSGTTIGVGYFVNGTQRTWGSVLGPLAAGASVNIGTQGGSYTIPSGTHTIMAYVDDVNRFAESNENNNQLSQSITIGTATPPPPPTSASTPDAIVAPSGGDFTNIGTAYSSASCGDLIHVRNGTYTLNSILSLNKNCTNGNEIIIRNYPGENPKIACNNPASSNDVKRVEANGQYNVWDGIEISNCWDGFKVHNSNNQILNSKIHNNIFSGIVISPLNPNISGIVIRGNTLEVNGYAESGNCTVGVATNCIEKTNPTNGQPLSLKNVQQIYFSNSTCNNIVGAQVDNNTIRNFGGRALQFNGLTGGSGSPCSSNGIRNIIFENNTILNGSWGMSFFYGSGNNIIRNNTFALNNWPNTNDSEHTFMGLWGVRDTQITENQFNSNTTVWPIYLSDSTSTCGTNNISSNTWDTNSNTWFYNGGSRNDFSSSFSSLTGCDPNVIQ